MALGKSLESVRLFPFFSRPMFSDKHLVCIVLELGDNGFKYCLGEVLHKIRAEVKWYLSPSSFLLHQGHAANPEEFYLRGPFSHFFLYYWSNRNDKLWTHVESKNNCGNCRLLFHVFFVENKLSQKTG